MTGTAANPVCLSGGACVPYNIFQDGGVTQDAVNYIWRSTAQRKARARCAAIHLDFTGELGEYGLKIPMANDGVGVNIGFERRQEDLVFAPDAAEQSGQLSGFGGAPVSIDKSQNSERRLRRSPRADHRRQAPFVRRTSCSTPAIVIPITR